MSEAILKPDVRTSFVTIKFADRVRALVNNHNYPIRSLVSVYQKNEVEKVLEDILQKPKYVASDKVFVEKKEYGPYTFKLFLDLRDGIIVTWYFLEVGGDPLIPGHQFGVFRALDEERTVLPKYKDYDELKVIVTEIKSIWDDFRDEFLRRKGIEIPSANISPDTPGDAQDEDPFFMDVPFKPETLTVPFTPSVIESLTHLEAFQSDLETALKKDPGNINVSIALAWVTMKIVEMGVHIDDVYEDTQRAVALVDAVKSDAKDQGYLLAEFEMDLQALLARTKAFADL